MAPLLYLLVHTGQFHFPVSPMGLSSPCYQWRSSFRGLDDLLKAAQPPRSDGDRIWLRVVASFLLSLDLTLNINLLTLHGQMFIGPSSFNLGSYCLPCHRNPAYACGTRKLTPPLPSPPWVHMWPVLANQNIPFPGLHGIVRRSMWSDPGLSASSPGHAGALGTIVPLGSSFISTTVVRSCKWPS